MLTLTLLNATTAALLGQLPICQAGNPWGDLEFWKVLVGITSLAVLLLTCLKIYAFFRRSPGIDVHFATKQELADGLKALADSGDARRAEIEGKIEDMRKSLTAQLGTLHRRMDETSTAEGLKMESIQRQLGEIIGEMRASRKASPAR